MSVMRAMMGYMPLFTYLLLRRAPACVSHLLSLNVFTIAGRFYDRWLCLMVPRTTEPAKNGITPNMARSITGNAVLDLQMISGFYIIDYSALYLVHFCLSLGRLVSH